MKTIFLKTFYTLLIFWWSGCAFAAFELTHGWLIFFALLLPLAIGFLFSQVRAARIAAAVAAVVAHQWLLGAGLIGHHSHVWPIASVVLIFISDIGENFSARDLIIVRAAQALALVPYFLAGVWRLLSVMSIDGFRNKLLAIHEFPKEVMAYSVAEGGGPLPDVAPWIKAFPNVILTGLLIFWAFELLAIVPVFAPRWTRIWGWWALVFHLSIGLTLSIWFTPMILSSFYLLVLTEEYLDRAKSGSTLLTGNNSGVVGH